MNSNNSDKNRIITKLRSEGGASITFALLLFLVCAALSAVILVAATTSAGRMSTIAESDQRYYSVMSAAELICSGLDGKSVSVVSLTGKGNDDLSGKPYVIGKAMNEITDSDFKTNVYIGTDDDDAVDAAEDRYPSAADNTEQSDPLAGGGSTTTAANGSSATGIAEAMTTLFDSNGSNTMELTVEDINEKVIEPLTVSIVMEDIDKNAGTAVLSISNKSGKRHFVMKASFSVEEEKKSPPLTKVVIDEDHTRLVDTDNTYETTWHLVKLASSYDTN